MTAQDLEMLEHRYRESDRQARNKADKHVSHDFGRTGLRDEEHNCRQSDYSQQQPGPVRCEYRCVRVMSDIVARRAEAAKTRKFIDRESEIADARICFDLVDAIGGNPGIKRTKRQESRRAVERGSKPVTQKARPQS